MSTQLQSTIVLFIMFLIFLWFGAEKWQALFCSVFLTLLKDIRDK